MFTTQVLPRKARQHFIYNIYVCVYSDREFDVINYTQITKSERNVISATFLFHLIISNVDGDNFGPNVRVQVRRGRRRRRNKSDLYVRKSRSDW